MADSGGSAFDYASELSHPFRFRLVAALTRGPRTLGSLAQELDAAETVVRHHLDRLRELGFVERDEQADGRVTYDLLGSVVISDDEWGAMPVESRRTAATTALTHVSARAAAAIDRGGFDRTDVHITRTTVTVDEAGWRRLATLFNEVLATLEEHEPGPGPAAAHTFQATGALLLFTEGDGDRLASPALPSNDEDALHAADALLDGLSGALTEPPVDWSTVEALAERLRFVARGAKTTPTAPVIPLRRPQRDQSGSSA